MKIIPKIFLLFLVLPMTLPADDNSGVLTELKLQIEANYYTFNSDTLESLLKRADYIYDSIQNWHLKYYASVLHIQLGKIFYNSDPDLAMEHFEKSADMLKDIDEENDHCEIKSLLSAAYGKISSLSGLTAIIHGIKARDYIYEAYKLDKNNPKFMLIAATHLMHTPSTFGGDKEKAEKLLRKALKINGDFEESDPLILEWATDAEIYAYLAQLEILKENKEKAKEYMQKALKIVPGYGFVLIDLQSQLDALDA